MQCREGQEGDNFYVIEEGVFKATKMVGPSRKELFTYEHHGAFGELAMMYNCPRAATVEVSSWTVLTSNAQQAPSAMVPVPAKS